MIAKPFWQSIASLCTITIALFGIISEYNELMHLRRKIPHLISENELLSDKIDAANFEIEQLSAPSRLLMAAKKPQFAHLRPAMSDDLINSP